MQIFEFVEICIDFHNFFVLRSGRFKNLYRKIFILKNFPMLKKIINVDKLKKRIDN